MDRAAVDGAGGLLRALYPDTPAAHAHAGKALDEATMRHLLADRPARIEHVLGVARTARELGPQLGLDRHQQDELVTAALFHDIGYTEALHITGFHPVDGAVFLAHMGAPDTVVAAVLGHGAAAEDAEQRDILHDLYRDIPWGGPLGDALSFADLRTAPDGSRITLPERILSVEQRYGPDDLVSRITRGSAPTLGAIRDRVLARIAHHAPDPLPWLFMDIDGTLIPYAREISSVNLNALRSYREAGGHVTLATGKMPYAMARIVADAALPGPHIASNGALLVCDGQSEKLAGLGDLAPPVAVFLRSRHIAYVIYTLDGIVVDSPDVTDAQIRSLTSHDEPPPISGEMGPTDRVLKILTFVHDVDEADDAALRAEAAGLGVSCIRTTPIYLEYVPLGHFKDAAMRRILADAAWPTFHTVAAGDGENDLALLRNAGLSAAVANATPHVRAVADLDLPDCGDDAIAVLIERLMASGAGA
jgi:Cof subfamily protein (haloacid dehalogenase superfamily)